MPHHAAKAPARKPLQRMFTLVPPRYDLINHVITLGLDARWRRLAARECLREEPDRVLDLCCGTGDLAIGAAEISAAEVIGIDYSRPMLEIASGKSRHLKKAPAFVYGDAAGMPFPDGSFDCVGISFAFRNLTYKNPVGKRSLGEVLRVLKEGGRFVIVETSQPKSKLVGRLFRLYLRGFVRPAGTLISGNRGAYRYLAESASHFYNSEEIKEMLVRVGFRKVLFRPLCLGAVGIHVAIK